MKQKKVALICPHCGHTQQESATAYSTTCKQCHQHIRVQDVLRPPRRPGPPRPESRDLTCYVCGTLLHVPASAKSTMCKRCSTYLDLADHLIAQSVSKNFRTKGTLTIEESGFLFNTETFASRVVLKGRFIGKLVAEQTLEIHPTARIKGTFQAGCLVIPAETRFAWPQPINAGSADIAGELVADLRCENTVRLQPTARLFGNVQAAHLVVQSGAVLVGSVRIGVP